MSIKVRELLRLVPDYILEEIGEDVGVDKINQKLTGERIFKVLLFSLAETTRISLRIIEKVYESALFQQLAMKKSDHSQARHSGFADRLSKINVRYFEAIFNHLVDKYHKNLPEKNARQIYRFDSTIIGISAKLFSNGLNNGGGVDRRHFKFTIGLKGLIPASVFFCKKAVEINEDEALRKAIAEAVIEKNDIIVFDRGIQSTSIYLNYAASGMCFVTRIRTNRQYKVLESLSDPTDTILSDQRILLNVPKTRNQYFNTLFRLVTVPGKKEKMYLFTNNFDLSAEEISEIYRRRWDIEVFFRFIKQELNLKHFLARNNNGMTVYVYMILIFSILLLIYKTKNSLSGFKFVKWDFFHELQAEIISDIVVICGGDPNIFLEKHGFI